MVNSVSIPCERRHCWIRNYAAIPIAAVDKDARRNSIRFKVGTSRIQQTPLSRVYSNEHPIIACAEKLKNILAGFPTTVFDNFLLGFSLLPDPTLCLPRTIGSFGQS